MSNKTSAKKGQGRPHNPTQIVKNIPHGQLGGDSLRPKTIIAKPTGRPSKYTRELADEICERLGNGESLRKITKDDHMPEGRTVWRWLRTNDEFRQQYALSKDEAADALAEDIQDIAALTLAGAYDPQASRVAIDAYKWTASKLKPKKYGDKIDMTTDGKALPQPILAMLNTKNGESDTKADVIEGEIVKEVPEKTAPYKINQDSTIMDDING